MSGERKNSVVIREIKRLIGEIDEVLGNPDVKRDESNLPFRQEFLGHIQQQEMYARGMLEAYNSTVNGDFFKKASIKNKNECLLRYKKDLTEIILSLKQK